MLPDEKRQTELQRHLVKLVDRRGFRSFLGPPREPTDIDFPDRWTPNPAGVERLIKRLMAYAGLRRYAVMIRIEHSPIHIETMGGDGLPGATCHAAAWFEGIEDGRRCVFGMDPGQLQAPDVLVGTLAHEVSHAYRCHHRLEVADDALEETLTDITAVFLGFGVLLAHSRGAYVPPPEETTPGFWPDYSCYLDRDDVCFLLGLQLAVQGTSASDTERLRSYLDPHKRTVVTDTVKRLSRDRAALLERLGLPDTSAFNEGTTVFRLVAGDRRFPGAFAAAIGVGAVAVLATSNLGIVLASAALAGAGVLASGARLQSLVCSDPDCGAPVRADEASCPSCRGVFAGTLKNRAAVVEAEEAQLKQAGLSHDIAQQLRDIAGNVNRGDG